MNMINIARSLFGTITRRNVTFSLCRLCVLTGLLMVTGAHRLSAADIGASLKFGSPGFGGDMTVDISEKLNLRTGLNYFSLTIRPEEERADSENITAELRLLTIPLLVDWHPYPGNFRLSAGLAWNGNKISASAKPGEELDFNDRAYLVDDFYGKISFNRISPYLGFGYGNAVAGESRWTLALDIGVFYHGAPQVAAHATAAHPALQPAMDRDLAKEVADLEDDLRPYRFYPVLTLGLSYRF